jgi:hypothetical protein
MATITRGTKPSKSPLKTIRDYCKWCSNDQPQEINLCPAEHCPLYAYRMGRMPDIKNPSPLGVIRKKCKDCVGGYPSDVAECRTECVLQPYRMGKNPNRSKRNNDRSTYGVLPENHVSENVI